MAQHRGAALPSPRCRLLPLHRRLPGPREFLPDRSALLMSLQRSGLHAVARRKRSGDGGVLPAGLGVPWSNQTDHPEQGDRPHERDDQAHHHTTARRTQNAGKDPPPQEGWLTGQASSPNPDLSPPPLTPPGSVPSPALWTEGPIPSHARHPVGCIRVL
jgi:hypothetical protein